MNAEQLVEWELEGKTKVPRKILAQYYFVLQKSFMIFSATGSDYYY
jgi:hypothetical protein